MKRYLLFSGKQYYPCGGWDDFDGSFDSAAEAHNKANQLGSEWYQVVDIQTGKQA